MIRSVMLQARWLGVPPLLAFTVDDETLELGGADAGNVRRMMLAAADVGSVVIDPYPTSVEITDPLRERGEFVAVLAVAYLLPDWLRAWLRPDKGEGEHDETEGLLEPEY